VKVETEYRRSRIEVFALVVGALLLGLYVILRYGEYWGETDTRIFVSYIQTILENGRLISDGALYEHGYGFPTLGVFLVQLTGLSINQLQLYGSTLLAAWIVIPAWIAYRALTDSGRAATLATVIIMLQPEFLFPILRGTHEKFTRGLMFLGLYLIVTSMQSENRFRRYAAYTVALYLTIYALITFNNLLAFSYLLGLALSVIFGIVASRYLGQANSQIIRTHRRLLYVLLISLILAFIYTFYAYEPAAKNILLLESVWDRLASMFFDFQETIASPYEVVNLTWTSTAVYFTLSIANWLLLIVSFIIWSSQTFAWLFGRARPENARALFLWSLFGAFGLMGAISILIDFSGAIAGNLQHRFFPSFSMVAAAVVAVQLVRWKRPLNRPGMHRAAQVFLVVAIFFLGIVAVMKATNEPLVSNKWLTHLPGERAAYFWAENLPDNASLWTALDERVVAGMTICCSEEIRQLHWYADGGFIDETTRNVLLSDLIRARAARIDFDLPIEGDSLRVYDNGTAEIYHLRPRSPFQK
jgi:hypothetical protein